MRARRLKGLREERSESEAYMSSNKSCALMNRPRYPFCRDFSNNPDAKPVFPTPGSPIKMIFSALARIIHEGCETGTFRSEIAPRSQQPVVNDQKVRFQTHQG